MTRQQGPGAGARPLAPASMQIRVMDFFLVGNQDLAMRSRVVERYSKTPATGIEVAEPNTRT